MNKNTIIYLLVILISACSSLKENVDVINKTRTDEDIQLQFQRNKSELFSIFNGFNLKNEIKITYQISINSNGHVVQVSILKSNSNNKKLEKKINDWIVGINFNKVEDPKIYTFKYPIDFLAN